MKLLSDIGLLFKRPFLQDFRDPTWLLVSGSTPLLYLVLFMPLLKHLGPGIGAESNNVIQVFLPGIIGLLAFGTGNFAGFDTIFLLRNGFIERIRVTPASRFAILIGPIIASICWSLIFASVIVAICVPFGFHIYLGGLLIYYILLMLLIVLFASLSTTIALLTKQISTFAAIVNGVNLPLILLAGVMLPLSLAPSWMRFVAHFNPLYYVVNAGRDLTVGKISTHQVMMAFIVVPSLAIVSLWWSSRILRKAVS